jgi:hypothetical protein
LATLAALAVAVAVAVAADDAHRAGPPRAPAAAVPGQPRFPIRAAFYYAWYPQNWRVGGRLSHAHPSLGRYSSSARRVQRAHIRALVYGRMDAAIASWTGPRQKPDSRLRGLLSRTVRMRAPLKWAVYHEGEGRGNPSTADIARDLGYIRRRLASSRAYLRVGGRFVVFVYNADDRSCEVVQRWLAANAQLGDPAYLVLKVFPGYEGCAQHPDAWHQYAPAQARQAQGTDAFELSPGFWKADEPDPRLARDLARFRGDIAAMVGSNARWQLVTTFNEWGEGTTVESAREWATRSGKGAYLDALHAGLATSGAGRPSAAPRTGSR